MSWKKFQEGWRHGKVLGHISEAMRATYAAQATAGNDLLTPEQTRALARAVKALRVVEGAGWVAIRTENQRRKR